MPRRADPNEEFLAPSEWGIFLVLSLSHPLTVKEISDELQRLNSDYSPGISTLSSLLQRLIARGYVRKLPRADAADPIRYEPAAPLDPAFRKHAGRLISDLTQLRREQLEALLEEVKAHLKELPPPPRQPRRRT